MSNPTPGAAASAREIIAGSAATPEQARALVEELHRERYFGLSRRALAALHKRDEFRRALDREPALRLALAHQRALSTYKDPDLPGDLKFREALDLLQAADPLEASRHQQTLGLAGAIHRRMWEHTGRERELQVARDFYLRGYRLGVATDEGYTGINAAFILDALADLQLDAQPLPGVAKCDAGSLELAREIRAEIVRVLATNPDEPHSARRNQSWWLLVTLGEAYFGLEEYEAAERCLLEAASHGDVPDWERESTARQLAALLRIQERRRERRGEPSRERAHQVLKRFLGDAAAACESVVRGKVGLALSGGGFRASLYHIGVLAKLAELDLLRHVEYLSCVSGGSIVGAHYYLEVRKLLQEKCDPDITRQDYIDIVARVCADFLAGVQRNIRTRIAAEWLTNLRMIFLSNYSRTMRAGDLYEREIFARVKDGEGARKRWLNELLIHPCGESRNFRPKDHNWRRAAKVPILVLNATTLNTGHNWQFTATWMGEPPAGIDSEVDGNYRLRRMYYHEAPKGHQRMRLGHAVAASACVPGLFEPLALADLYERMPADGKRRIRPIVRLVDGGVFDNQGTAALLEQDCSVLLVSDASGQMGEDDKPASGVVGVPLRANSILQARVRVSQFQDLDSRRRAGTLKGLMFVHLKKGLDTPSVDWVDTQDASDAPASEPRTDFGVQKSIQRRLAAVRTDLDSFSEAEAYALMTSAYLMTGRELEKPVLGFPLPPPVRGSWKFLEIAPMLKEADSKAWLHRQLKVASKLAFKVWLVARGLQIGAGVLALLALSYLGVGAIRSWDAVVERWGQPLFQWRPTLGAVAGTVALALISLLGLAGLAKLLNYRKTVQQILIGLGMASVGFLLARLHLHFFDRLFLWQGRLTRAGGGDEQAGGSDAVRRAVRPA